MTSNEEQVKRLEEINQQEDCPAGGKHTLGRVDTVERGGKIHRSCGRCDKRLFSIDEGWY